MHIEIQQPELEALIQQRMDSGAFHDVEEALLYALKSAPISDVSTTSPQTARGKSLEEVFAKARGLADDVDFSRDSSTSRPVDLS